jgi:hypothetical protein
MSKIASLIEKHEKMRNTGINLIASENLLSPGVRKALASDLAGRYCAIWLSCSPSQCLAIRWQWCHLRLEDILWA